MANYLSRHDQKVHLIFQKLCFSGHQSLLFKWFQNEKGVFIEMDLLPTVITNSFKIPVIQKFENISTHIFVTLDLFYF